MTTPRVGGGGGDPRLLLRPAAARQLGSAAERVGARPDILLTSELQRVTVMSDGTDPLFVRGGNWAAAGMPTPRGPEARDAKGLRLKLTIVTRT